MTIYSLFRALAFPSLNGLVVGVAPSPRTEQAKAAYSEVSQRQDF